MKHLIYLLLVFFLFGCSQSEMGKHVANVGEPPTVSATKKDDSTACAYWKCSTTKKLYMQKYVKDATGNYRPAGAFKLDEGEGAFPLDDLDKYSSDGNTVSVDVGFASCPYDGNSTIINCRGKTYCERKGATEGTCPWCGSH